MGIPSPSSARRFQAFILSFNPLLLAASAASLRASLSEIEVSDRQIWQETIKEGREEEGGPSPSSASLLKASRLAARAEAEKVRKAKKRKKEWVEVKEARRERGKRIRRMRTRK